MAADSIDTGSVVDTGSDGILAPAAIEAFVRQWFRLLDNHSSVAELEAMVSDDVVFEFPEGPKSGRYGFREWYEAVTRLFFDHRHRPRVEDIVCRDGRALVRVVVNWQTHRWVPPAPRSEWIGFHAFQRWEVVPSPAGDRLLIDRYIVDDLQPMAGTPEL